MIFNAWSDGKKKQVLPSRIATLIKHFSYAGPYRLRHVACSWSDLRQGTGTAIKQDPLMASSSSIRMDQRDLSPFEYHSRRATSEQVAAINAPSEPIAAAHSALAILHAKQAQLTFSSG